MANRRGQIFPFHIFYYDFMLHSLCILFFVSMVHDFVFNGFNGIKVGGVALDKFQWSEFSSMTCMFIARIFRRLKFEFVFLIARNKQADVFFSDPEKS